MKWKHGTEIQSNFQNTLLSWSKSSCAGAWTIVQYNTLKWSSWSIHYLQYLAISWNNSRVKLRFENQNVSWAGLKKQIQNKQIREQYLIWSKYKILKYWRNAQLCAIFWSGWAKKVRGAEYSNTTWLDNLKPSPQSLDVDHLLHYRDVHKNTNIQRTLYNTYKQIQIYTYIIDHLNLTLQK